MRRSRVYPTQDPGIQPFDCFESNNRTELRDRGFWVAGLLSTGGRLVDSRLVDSGFWCAGLESTSLLPTPLGVVDSRLVDWLTPTIFGEDFLRADKTL